MRPDHITSHVQGDGKPHSSQLNSMSPSAFICDAQTSVPFFAGPSLVSLLALSSEVQTFLAQSLPPLLPLLAFRTNVSASADLSALLATDPARATSPYSLGNTRQSSSDARGSMPWELVCRGVLATAADMGGNDGSDARRGGASGVPLAAALTAMSLFGDAVDTAQAQEVSSSQYQSQGGVYSLCLLCGLTSLLPLCVQLRSDCPDTQNALARQQQLYRRQAKWCLDTFVHAAARRVWATYKVSALPCGLGGRLTK